MAIWDRMEGEALRAYEAFLCYRDMGQDRSLRKVQHELNYKQLQSIGRLSSKYNWVNRVAAWEENQRQTYAIELKAQFEADRKEARAKRQKTIKTLHDLLTKVIDASNADMPPYTLNQLATAARTVLDQSRQEFNDLPPARHELTGANGGPIQQQYSLADMSDSDLDDIINS